MRCGQINKYLKLLLAQFHSIALYLHGHLLRHGT
jgi:hypothetical protein